MNIELSTSDFLKYQQNQEPVKQQQVIYYVNIQQPNGSSLTQVPICDAHLNNSEFLQYKTTGVASGIFPTNNKEVPNHNLGYKPLGSCENPIEIIRDGERIHSTQNLTQDHLQQIARALQTETVQLNKNFENTNVNTEPNVIYQVVYPEQIDLKAPNSKATKRGRPKKPAPVNKVVHEEVAKDVKHYKSIRTRSGRVTRTPLYIKKDFKKIEISELDNMETELKTVDFEAVDEVSPPKSPRNVNLLKNSQPKRYVSSQVRCPKCNKGYLGYNKMLKHLEQFPDHGPIPDHFKLKYDDTWNYLINLCKKKPDGEKGIKFCHELCNFLRNLQDFAKTFFQPTATASEKLYFVDDFLSHTLGISSGRYYLQEEEFKKVTKQLLKNKGFKTSEKFANNDKLEKSDKLTQNNVFKLSELSNSNQFASKETVVNSQHNEKPHSILQDSSKSNSLPELNFREKLNFDLDNHEFLNCSSLSEKQFTHNLQSDHMLNDFTEKNVSKPTSMNPELSLSNELLADNLLLNSLPNLRSSVDDIMLNTGPNLLDNSTSSDEVMNVDQFVNERFKNLTEADLDLANTSLNLDLQGLDLFQFPTN